MTRETGRVCCKQVWYQSHKNDSAESQLGMMGDGGMSSSSPMQPQLSRLAQITPSDIRPRDELMAFMKGTAHQCSLASMAPTLIHRHYLATSFLNAMLHVYDAHHMSEVQLEDRYNIACGTGLHAVYMHFTIDTWTNSRRAYLSCVLSALQCCPYVHISYA